MKLILLSLLVIYLQFIVTRIEAQKCENPILINNVKVPSTLDLVKLGFGLGFTPGKSIQFVGRIKLGSSCIKLAEPGKILESGAVVLHFSPRPGIFNKHIERNSWSKATGWTPVDSSGGWPIKSNNQFEMEWIAGPNNAITINIDKNYFTTYNKWDTSKVAQLNIVDAIEISSIKLCGGKPDPTPPPPKCENPIVIDNVKVPSTFDLVKLGFGLGFTPGKSIQFVGKIKSGSSCIKLAEPGKILESGAVVLHFSPRPGIFNKHIERNSWSKATGWTPVDSSGGWPIKSNNQFEMEWIAGPNNAIIINIDKNYFTTYNKWDTSKVAQLNIVDAIEISSIKLCGGKPDPTPPPPTCPNEVLITNVSIGNINLLKYGFGVGFTVGKSIIITGTFLNGGSCIKLANKGVILVTADVKCHLATDPTKKLTICNSWIKGKGWTPEDRTGGYPFKSNQFVMEWIAEPNNTIRMNVDGKFWRTFSREDLSDVEQLDFSYAIKISSVRLCRQDIETTTPEIPTTPTPPPNCPNEVLITNVSIGNVNLLNYGFGIGFTEGKSIIMTGKLLNGGSCIKLGTAGVLLVTADAVFHLSPDNNKKQVICNSWMKGKGWTPEDKTGVYPFNPNNEFVMEWIAEADNTIRIIVDGKLYKTFKREDLSKVVQLDFSYAIRISSIRLCRPDIETTTTEIQTTPTPPPTCPNEILITNVSIGNINLLKYGFGIGFTVGKSIIITGTFLNGGSCIKLANKGVILVTADVKCHLATDPTKKLTICNSWIKGKGWTPEDRTGGYPFKSNQFVMEWIAEPNNTIRMNVDGKFWRTFSREDLSDVEQLDFSYAIKISSVRLCRQDIETTTPEIPTTPTPPPNCPNEILITNVSIGNVNLLNYGFGIGFTEGKSIIMTGKLLNGGSCIKLGTAGVLLVTADAVFHLSPDNNKKQVICNSWMKGKGWTPEDKTGVYPFNANNEFVMEWIAEADNTIRIIVDGKLYKTFKREDLSKVVQLDFSYAISIKTIRLCRADEITTTTAITPTTPPPNVPCPYFSLKLDLAIPIAINLENGFKPGKHITIIGTPTDSFTDFVVGLGEPGIMRETANVLFSFSPQLNSKSVTVNTLLLGVGWETELTYGHSPFKVGEPFVLEIKAGLNNQIDVFVNFVAYLRFTRHDLSKVSQIQIIRAVKVCSIVTCN